MKILCTAIVVFLCSGFVAMLIDSILIEANARAGWTGLFMKIGLVLVSVSIILVAVMFSIYMLVPGVNP